MENQQFHGMVNCTLMAKISPRAISRSRLTRAVSAKGGPAYGGGQKH